MKALAFIKVNQANSITVSDVVRHIGFCERHLERAFRKTFGQTIKGAILAERIRKAKSLLLETNMAITGLALESGFGDYVNFAKVFRKKVGLSPSEFRKQVTELKEIPAEEQVSHETEGRGEWYNDSFAGSNLGPNWLAGMGHWQNENGCLSGNGALNRIAFLKPLPENCRISFEAQLEGFQELGYPSLSVWLMDETQSRTYCEFSIAAGTRTASMLRHFRHGNQWNSTARMDLRNWYGLSLEIRDNTLRFTINGQPAFLFRDSFPPAYSSRCYLHLGTWHGTIQVRKFSIQNLGFMPVSHPVRQGDVLYNAGLFEKAMDFYLRFLESGSAGDAEVMELRYKVGICLLRQKSFSAAQNWIDKVVALREEPFWAQQARVSLLELFWKTADLQSFRSHLRLCMGDPKIIDQARIITQLAVSDFDARGFYDASVVLLEEWSLLEREVGYGFFMAKHLLTEHYGMCRRFEKAENDLAVIRDSCPFEEFVLSARINLMQLYHEWGKISQSEQMRSGIEKDARDPFFLARCMLQQAANLRAQEKFEQALDILTRVPGKYATQPNFSSHAKVQSALILCCMQRLDEGRNALEEARSVDPGFYPGSRHYLPFQMAEGNCGAAAESLLNDYRNAKDLVSASAELGVKAGILHELAGFHQEAKSIFKEVSLRFPKEQVRYFGQLAHELFAGEYFDASGMPYEHFRRSEVFYLIGLLHEKRGDKEAARSFFEHSVKDDPALRWPAFFSKLKLKT